MRAAARGRIDNSPGGPGGGQNFVLTGQEGKLFHPLAWAKTQMANYKYPRAVEFREDLPMTATGKKLRA